MLREIKASLYTLDSLPRDPARGYRSLTSNVKKRPRVQGVIFSLNDILSLAHMHKHAHTHTLTHTVSSVQWEGLIVWARGNAHTAEDRPSIDPSIDSSRSQLLLSLRSCCYPTLFQTFYLNPSLSVLFVISALQSPTCNFLTPCDLPPPLSLYYRSLSPGRFWYFFLIACLYLVTLLSPTLLSAFLLPHLSPLSLSVKNRSSFLFATPLTSLWIRVLLSDGSPFFSSPAIYGAFGGRGLIEEEAQKKEVQDKHGRKRRNGEIETLKEGINLTGDN